MEDKEIIVDFEKEDGTDYKMLFAQEALASLKLELALDEAIERIVSGLATTQEVNFDEACESLKVELLDNAHNLVLGYLNNSTTDEESSDE